MTKDDKVKTGKDGQEPQFQTHIAEPRALQILSVIVAIILVALWCLMLFSSHK